MCMLYLGKLYDSALYNKQTQTTPSPSIQSLYILLKILYIYNYMILSTFVFTESVSNGSSTDCNDTDVYELAVLKNGPEPYQMTKVAYDTESNQITNTTYDPELKQITNVAYDTKPE